jgi:hypothetical protein
MKCNMKRRITRRLITALAGLALMGLELAGCAAHAPAPVASLPPATPTIPAAPPRGEPDGFVNLPAAQLRTIFGAPAFVRHDGATEMWRYDGAACRAFFFLYGTDNQRVVRHVETLPRGQTSAADPACLTALHASPAKTS